MDAQTPFMFGGGEGVNAGKGEVEWVVAKERWVDGGLEAGCWMLDAGCWMLDAIC